MTNTTTTIKLTPRETSCFIREFQGMFPAPALREYGKCLRSAVSSADHLEALKLWFQTSHPDHYRKTRQVFGRYAELLLTPSIKLRTVEIIQYAEQRGRVTARVSTPHRFGDTRAAA